MAVLRALGLALFAFLLLAPSRAATPGEYQVKAVFLYNFSRFVEWPETAFADPKSPFVVGVFGFDPFGADLDEAVRGESVRGHPLVVRRVRNAPRRRRTARSCSSITRNATGCRKCSRRWTSEAS